MSLIDQSLQRFQEAVSGAAVIEFRLVWGPGLGLWYAFMEVDRFEAGVAEFGDHAGSPDGAISALTERYTAWMAEPTR